MDFGAVVDGYHADMTRTVVLGAADDRFRQVYGTVLAAQQAAARGARMVGQDAELAARLEAADEPLL
jgi:Xaa-Pro aminopeptidase